MKKMNNILCKVLVMSALMLTGLSPSESADVFSHSVLTLPDDPKIEESWVKIIRNQSKWESHFYATTAAITYPENLAPVAPVLDFENFQVISGGLGRQFISGHYLAIESVHELESEVIIHVLSVGPKSGCLVYATLFPTYPSITFLVKKTDKPINFTVSELIIKQCAD